ncbi:hypothetical protein [Agromyces mariniharenae]|uniref:DUF4398 domain-containing protein n=1 Tax=Agromyces mariniharenae TaxID=2604423 RepID=A0A5S4V7M4_9MICO|nr:hypothetical protein [Agromyces mariniharenae]TYL53281.1 hypothetical protein FYC51_06225 [Agromyces mariniharenae]
MQASGRPHAARVAASGALVLAVVLLAGCASPDATFEAAVGQGVAAIETARLVVDQELDGRTFPTTALATLGDARRELVDATDQVAETDAAAPAEAETRTEVLDALDAALDAVNAARDALASGVGSLEAVVPQLDAAADGLTALEPTVDATGDAAGSDG